jgi:glyceraldehyde-3-phosphate dehydrogenase (NAD(P))
MRREKYYEDLTGPGFHPGARGFGKPYARGINEEILVPGEDRFIQVVSCNTHNISTLIKTISHQGGNDYSLERGTFVCMRRSNDISQSDSFVPAPNVGKHDDPEFGTHHAHDAHRVFETLGKDFNLFSSAVKLNTQYMHSSGSASASTGTSPERSSSASRTTRWWR